MQKSYPSRLALLLLLLACVYPVFAAGIVKTQEGEAVYYSDRFHGRKTASGAIYDKNKMTAAHRSLKFGTKVKVTYLKTGKSVEVTITDRGPKKTKNRIIDLSRAAAKRIGLIKAGHGRVRLDIYGS